MGVSSTTPTTPRRDPGGDADPAVTRRMFAAFLRAAALVEPLDREIAAQVGVSLADLHAVRVLQLSGAMPVSRLGGVLGLPRSTATNLVDRLERAGLVDRLPSHEDRRVTLVRPSEAGLEAMGPYQQVRESELVRRLLALDGRERALLADLLERIASSDGPTPTGAASTAVADGSAPAVGA